ncbi:MAG: hypothetical protein ACRDPH_09725 [Marmoricola sp.]
MTGAVRKGVVLIVVIFLLFYLFTDPNGLAAFARDGSSALWHGLRQLFSALISFLDALFGK